jgi:hypothetical protein
MLVQKYIQLFTGDSTVPKVFGIRFLISGCGSKKEIGPHGGAGHT